MNIELFLAALPVGDTQDVQHQFGRNKASFDQKDNPPRIGHFVSF